MKWYRHIPNLLTLGNVLCGSLAAIYAFKMQFDTVAILVGFCLFFDFLDGTAARLLQVNSTIGKDLDSLADMVSFGLVPALVLFNYWEPLDSSVLNVNLAYSVFVIPLLSAMRLAAFNNREQSPDYFEGLATPTFAIACYAIPLAANYSIPVYDVLNAPAFILLFPVLGSLLLVSKVKFLSYKLGGTDSFLNLMRWSSLLTFGVCIAFFKFFGLFLCLLIYMAISLTIQKRFKSI